MSTTQRERSAQKRATARRTDRREKGSGLKISTGGARFGLFAFHYCRQAKGRWRNHPLGLEPFQIEVMSELLQVEREAWLELTMRQLNLSAEELWIEVREWLQEQEYGGLRVHREALLGWPKKNGKSTMTASLALYLLIGDDEPGAEVYSLASAKDQARIVFADARRMVEKSPRLLERLRLYRDAIADESNDAIYKVLSADADVQEGINPSGAIVDEVHAHKSRHLYDTVRTAMIAREQPLLTSITTAGIGMKDKRSGDLTIAGDLYQRGAGTRPKYRLRKLADGGLQLSEVVPREDKQRSFYFRWFEVPWRHRENPRYWKAANPASWLTDERLAEEAEIERPRGIFYRYHCNIWTRVESYWLKPGAWEKCARPALKLRAGDPVIVTVDFAKGYDTCALTVTRAPLSLRPNHPDVRAGKIVQRWAIWGVHDDPKKPPPPAHFVQDEGEIDADVIEQAVRDIATGADPKLCERLGLKKGTSLRVIAVGGDPFKFSDQLRHLEDTGVEVVEFAQGQQMVAASEAYYRAIGQADVAHDADPVVATHIDNAVAREVGGGRFRLDKKAAAEKMDGAVSGAMGVFLALNPEIARAGRPSLTLL